jgi:hypothetical protein
MNRTIPYWMAVVPWLAALGFLAVAGGSLFRDQAGIAVGACTAAIACAKTGSWLIRRVPVPRIRRRSRLASSRRSMLVSGSRIRGTLPPG